MKTNKLMLLAACTAILASCNKNEKSTEAPVDPVAAKEAAAKDSIQKAEKAELELFKKDSIDASQIKGYTVKLVSGKHKYDGKTEITYQSLSHKIEEIKKTAAKEMWAEDKLDEKISAFKEEGKGGMLSFRFDRITIDAANTDMFTVIVKDANDKEIYREDLPGSVPNHSNDMWYNFGVAIIPERINTPFYVYLVDKLQDEPFKYEVTALKK